MKKILVINNDYQLPKTAIDFAIQVALENNAVVYGMFVQSIQNTGTDSYFFPNDLNLTDKDLTATSDEEENLQYKNTNMKLFGDMCTIAGVPYKMHSVFENFLDTLIDHSAFSDLIISDADTTPSQYSIKTLLANAHCPVLLVNRDYRQTDTLIFAYDDKSTSMHAVKMFTYLFRFYKDLPAYFVSVVSSDVLGIEYADLLKEWLPLHYSNVQIKILKGETKEELSGFINNTTNPLVVMGAYGRSSLSRFFKESLANIILERTNAPIFITHE